MTEINTIHRHGNSDKGYRNYSRYGDNNWQSQNGNWPRTGSATRIQIEITEQEVTTKVEDAEIMMGRRKKLGGRRKKNGRSPRIRSIRRRPG